MIFDLKSGKRRRAVQVVFGLLAFIFFISFVGFGIGSNASGGIFDALGIGGGSSGGSSSPQYQEQIDDAQSTLESDPNNEQALLDLVRYHYLSATQGVSTDPQTGATDVSEDAKAELEGTASAWQDYLKAKPAKPNIGAAANAVQAYVLLNDAEGAASAQKIVADSQKSAAAYAQLAFYRYFKPDIKGGDAAAKQAIAAADPAQRQQVKQNLEAYAAQAKKIQKQLAKQRQQANAPGAEAQQLENPFGGLSGSPSGVGAPPAAP